MTEAHAETLRGFYRAFMQPNAGGIRATVADDTTWYVGGRSKVAGEHTGAEGIVALRASLAALSGGTLRVLHEGSVDIAVSAAHAFLHDVWVAQRGDEKLSVHIGLVVHVDGSLVSEVFTFFEDQYSFDEFFS